MEDRLSINGLTQQAPLTLMLLMANLAKTKWWEKLDKWLKPWHMGANLSTQQMLSNEWIQTWQGLDVFQKSLCPCP